MGNEAQITDIIKLIDPRLAVWLPWVALVSMIGVDWIKTAVTFPKWGAPAACLGISIAMTLILIGAMELGASGKIISQGLLMSLAATVIAMGASTLKERGKPSQESEAIQTKVADRVAAETAIAVDKVATVATDAVNAQGANTSQIADEVVAKIVARMERVRS